MTTPVDPATPSSPPGLTLMPPAASAAGYPPPPPPPSAPAPRQVTVHAINWSNVLDFTHIFRGFRLAINPAKLAMALMAIMLIYTAGRLFDAMWGPQVYADELPSFISQKPEVYAGLRRSRLMSREDSLENMLERDSTLSSAQRDELKKKPAAAYRDLRAYYRREFQAEIQSADERRRADQAAGRTFGGGGGGGDNAKTPAEIQQDDHARAAARLLYNMQQLRAVTGRGIFDTFMQYETAQFDQLVENTLTFVRVSPVRSSVDAGPAAEASAVSGGLISRDPQRIWRSDTVAGCIANMTITAPRWLFTGTAPIQARPTEADARASAWAWAYATRAWYLFTLTLFAIFSLVVLAFTGASIARLSALELAGVERAPLAQVFLFALRRLWVFIKAPIMPFLMLLAVGCLMAVGGLMGAIPFIGPLMLGVIFFLFLLGAFVLMLLMLGIIGGFNLLYPTIAVEGSDAFDAMSRSFAYVYARPWRLMLYTVASLIYGAVTFLFVSFAVYLILLLTHTFVGWGANFFGLHYGQFSGVPLLETLWPAPQFLRLVQPINWYAMSWPEYVGALFLHFWVFLLITGIGAYVVSYYFSTHTIVYLLLRRSVDGQGIREVYLDEEPVAAPTATIPASVPA